MAYSAKTISEHAEAGEMMNHKWNNEQKIIAPSLKQEEHEHIGKSASIITNPYTMMVGDMTVRLSFSDSGDLSTRLANALHTMLN